jgi:hypothetical protein
MMPDRMKRTHPGPLFLWVVVTATLAASCTTSTATEPDSSGTSGIGSRSDTVTPEATAIGPPGAAVYRYANPGLLATLSLEGESGTLAIENDTGRELAPPGLYVLEARTGARVEGEVKDPSAIPDGEMKTFRVSFSELGTKDVGLVILLIGRDNFGAFARQ